MALSRRFRSSLETSRSFFLIACLLTSAGYGESTFSQEAQEDDQPKTRFVDNGKRLRVMLGQLLFTEYDYSSYKKPIFYPLHGPNQISMTRSFPMKKVKGEANDHRHHKSMWIGHQINGVDFWSEKGRVKLTRIRTNENQRGFTANHEWLNEVTNELVVRDQLRVAFDAGPGFRSIDYQIKFIAPKHDVVFDDTKEGFFAVRVHPALRHANDVQRGVVGVTGSMTNSKGMTGKKIWGQRAKWVDYSGAIESQNCGIAIFDHPENLRHPTTWHARDYGLLAANPFGLRHFQKKPKGAGQFVLRPGKEIIFRYLVYMHGGDINEEQLNRAFDKFAKRQVQTQKKPLK